MIKNIDFFNQYNDVFSWSAIESSSFEDYSNDYDDSGDNIMDKFAIQSRIDDVKHVHDIPLSLYTGMNHYHLKCNENTAENKDSDEFEASDYKIEISSVDGEKRYRTTPLSDVTIKPQFTFNRGLSVDTEATPRKNSTYTNYEVFFTLVEDKNKYSIGNSDDALNMGSINDIKTLSSILSSTETDMNDFIGDMLK